jgi:preprotein translocase subunit SecF
LRVVSYQGVLLKEPNNITAKNGLAAASANETKSVALINSKLISEIADLKPLIANNTSYNASDAAGMQKLARNLYANASSIYEVHVINVLKGIVSFTTYSYNDVTPTLGSFFLTEVTNIIIVAFVLVAITVFVIFRTPVPAFAVVYGAANDIVIALGAMGAFHIPLGVVSVGGLLMLIGYSMDTDILSTIRVLRRSEGTAGERAMATFRTGITMTAAAIISFATLFAIAYITFIPEYIQISGVVLVGLVADIVTTWFGNAVIIVWYKRRHEHAH